MLATIVLSICLRHFFHAAVFCLVCTIVFSSHPVIAEIQRLRLAVEPSPPFSHIDDEGVVTGLEVDIADALATGMGTSLETVACPWARCLKMAEQGDVDIVIGLSKTSAREQKFVFLDPPFISSILQISTYQRADARFDVSSLADFRALKVGVQRGAVHFKAFDNDPLITKIYVKDIQSLFNMLLVGRVDAFIMPTVAANEYLFAFDTENEIKRASFTHLIDQGGYIALSKKSPLIENLETLQQVLRNLKSTGKLDTILTKYNL